MQKYQIGDYRILNALPSSFQVSTKNNSYKLFQTNPDPEAEYPLPISIQEESLTEDHALLYTLSSYMRINWIEDEYEPNGQIEIGMRPSDKDTGLDFAYWNTVLNDIPKEVIKGIITIIRNPEEAQRYKVPLFLPEESNNNTPPPPPPPPKVKKWKKRVFNKTAKQPQRRLRND